MSPSCVRWPTLRAGRIPRRVLSGLVAAASVLTLVGCRSARSPAAAGGGAPGTAADFVCDGTHDYRAFKALPALGALNELAPRKAQTPEQRETLTPGDPLWRLQEVPDASCSPEGYLELRYAATDAKDFASARNRVTVTVAPVGRLLDPVAYQRLAALASALDEALALLRTKTCSEAGAPCDLKRNQNPLRFPGSHLQYSLGGEFKKVGQRGWYWYTTRGPYQVLRAVLTTGDGRFDVEVLVETTGGGPEDATDSLALLPERISDGYDKMLRAGVGAAARGGPGG